MFLEHKDAQETPKTAKKPPKMAPSSLQEPLEKKAHFGIDFLVKVDPKMNPKVVQQIEKTGSENNSKDCSNIAIFESQKSPQNYSKWQGQGNLAGGL